MRKHLPLYRGIQGLGSDVVPCGVCYGFLTRSYNKLHKEGIQSQGISLGAAPPSVAVETYIY